ncbi:hypothetical protein ABG067_007437, partial [Albugo candida]
MTKEGHCGGNKAHPFHRSHANQTFTFRRGCFVVSKSEISDVVLKLTKAHQILMQKCEERLRTLSGFTGILPEDYLLEQTNLGNEIHVLNEVIGFLMKNLGIANHKYPAWEQQSLEVPVLDRFVLIKMQICNPKQLVDNRTRLRQFHKGQ